MTYPSNQPLIKKVLFFTAILVGFLCVSSCSPASEIIIPSGTSPTATTTKLPSTTPSATPTTSPSPTLSPSPSPSPLPTLTDTPQPTPFAGVKTNQILMLCTDGYAENYYDYICNPANNQCYGISNSGYFLHDLQEGRTLRYISEQDYRFSWALADGIDPDFLENLEFIKRWFEARCCASVLAVSPDGKSMIMNVYSEAGGDQGHLYWAQTGMTTFRKILTYQYHYYLDDIAINQNHVAIKMPDEEGKDSIFIIEFASGNMKKLPNQDAYELNWVPGHPLLSYWYREGIGLYNAETGQNVLIARDGGSHTWSPTGQEMIFKRDSALFSLDRKSLEVKSLTELNNYLGENSPKNISLSPDGRYLFSMVSVRETSSRKYQWLLWDREKKKGTVIAQVPDVYYVFLGNKPRWSPDGKWLLHDFVLTPELINPSIKREGGGVSAHYLCNVIKKSCQRLGPEAENPYICRNAAWNKGLNVGETNSLLREFYKLDKGSRSLAPFPIEQVTINNPDPSGWYGEPDWRSPILIQHPFQIDVEMDRKNGSYTALTLHGKLREPYGEWWEGVHVFIVGKGENHTWVEVRDGRYESTNKILSLTGVEETDQLSIMFYDPKGKSFSVLDGNGDTVRFLVDGQIKRIIDVTQLNGIHLPDGLFPNHVVYPGFSLGPEAELELNRFDLTWDLDYTPDPTQTP